MVRTSVCVVLLLASLAAAKVRYDGHKLVAVRPANRNETLLLERLRENYYLELDFWTSPHAGKDVDIHVTPKHVDRFLQFLEKNEIDYSIKSHDIQFHIGQASAPIRHIRETQADAILGTYPRHSNINSWLDTMVSRYPFMASTQCIGKSYEGRDMKVIKICSSGRCGEKPAIFLDAGIHAREWITVPTLMHAINQLLVGEDSEVVPLLAKFDFYLLPVVNPDGYEYTHTDDRLWRKTRTFDAPTGCHGADPNRNFDVSFGGAGSSDNPCANTYHGSSAFSEPCTANVRDFVNSTKDKLVLYISLHAYSQLWLTPWGFTGEYRPSDARELDRVANLGADAIRSVNGLTFTVGTPPQILYEACGVSHDWVKKSAGVKYSYSLELRPHASASLGFVLHESNIEPSGREIFKAIKTAANAMDVKDSGNMLPKSVIFDVGSILGRLWGTFINALDLWK